MPNRVMTEAHTTQKKDKKQEHLTIGLYIFSFLSIIAISICWLTLDISLTFIHPFNDPEQSGLQTLSWGSLNIVLGFIMKTIICMKLCPNSLSTAEKWQLLTIGSLIRVACAWAIRFPLYMRYRYYPALQFKDQMVQWLLSDSSTFFLATILAVSIRNLLEYVTMPHYIHSKFRAFNPFTNSESTKAKEPQKTSMGYVSIAWIILWSCGIIIGAAVGSDFYSQNNAFLFGILWAPFLAVLFFLYQDKEKAETRRFRPLSHDLAYIVLYLWIIELIPDLCSNILWFAYSPHALTNSSIFWSFIYQSFMVLMKILTENILVFAGHGRPIHEQLLFPVQFFKTFFENLFFIELSLSDPVFWTILLMQMLYEAYGGIVGVELGSIRRLLSRKLKKSSQNLQKDSEEELRDLFEKRFELRTRIVGVFQDFLAELTTVAALLTTYYAYINFVYFNQGGQAAASYSQFFGINNFKTQFYDLAYQFMVVSALRLLFHAIVVLVLRQQVSRFNESIPQEKAEESKKRALLHSEDLLAMKNAESDQIEIKAIGRIPRLSIARLIYQHLTDDWWLFFVVVSLSITRLCFLARSGLYELSMSPDVSYWGEMIFLRLLVN